MKGKTVGFIVLGLVLLIEVPRFYGTYSQIDPPILGLPLTAFATGIALPLGAAYVFHTWWITTYKKHKSWLFAAFGGLLLLEGVILIPWGMSRLQAVDVTDVLDTGLLTWLWISIVMLSPFVLVGATVMAMAFQKDAKKVAVDEPRQKERQPKFEGKEDMAAWLFERNPLWTRQQIADKVAERFGECSPTTAWRGMNRNGDK